MQPLKSLQNGARFRHSNYDDVLIVLEAGQDLDGIPQGKILVASTETWVVNLEDGFEQVEPVECPAS